MNREREREREDEEGVCERVQGEKKGRKGEGARGRKGERNREREGGREGESECKGGLVTANE